MQNEKNRKRTYSAIGAGVIIVLLVASIVSMFFSARLGSLLWLLSLLASFVCWWLLHKHEQTQPDELPEDMPDDDSADQTDAQ